MGDYIERQAAVYAVRNHFCDSERTLETIMALPAADVRPVVRGRWKYFHKQNRAVCTVCSFERDLDQNFGRAIACPNCGADMRGGDEL